MEGHEERCCRVCLQMSHLSASQGRASKTCRALTVFSDPSVEMGENHDGFCGRTAALSEWL